MKTDLLLVSRNASVYAFIFIALIYSFMYTIQPVFGWYTLNLNPSKILFSFFITIILALILPIRFSRPSSFFLHLQFFFPILPMLVMFGVSDFPTVYILMIIMAFVGIVFFRNLKLKPIFLLSLSPKLFVIGLLAISYFILFYELTISGKGFNLDLANIYEFRELNDQSSTASLILYLIAFTGSVFLPFASVISYTQKFWFLLLLSILGSLLIFGMTNHKSAIFYPFLALATYLFLETKSPIRNILLSAFAFIFLSLIVFDENNFFSVLFTSLGVRRILFEPSLINFFYYDFFSNNPYVYWSNSRISFGLLDYPYNLDPAHQIGYVYYGSQLAGANTGWLGSGFMHAGAIGLFLYSVIIGLLLSYLDSIRTILPARVIVALTVSPVFIMFLSSDLFSSLLTHGVLLSFVLLSFLQLNTKSN